MRVGVIVRDGGVKQINFVQVENSLVIDTSSVFVGTVATQRAVDKRQRGVGVVNAAPTNVGAVAGDRAVGKRRRAEVPDAAAAGELISAASLVPVHYGVDKGQCAAGGDTAAVTDSVVIAHRAIGKRQRATVG